MKDIEHCLHFLKGETENLTTHTYDSEKVKDSIVVIFLVKCNLTYQLILFLLRIK